MYTYKLKIKKVSGRLNESTRRNGITLRVKSSKNLSKKSLFNKADSYLNEKYGVRLLESEIEDYRRLNDEIMNDEYHDDISNGILSDYGKAKFNRINNNTDDHVNRLMDKIDIDALKEDIAKTIIGYGLQTIDNEVEEQIEIRKIGQSRMVNYPKRNVFSADINIRQKDKLDVREIQNIIGSEANAILRKFESNLRKCNHIRDLKYVIENLSEELDEIGVDYMGVEDYDLYDEFIYERGDVVEIFENYISALRDKIDNIAGRFISYIRNHIKTIILNNPNRNTLVDKIIDNL